MSEGEGVAIYEWKTKPTFLLSALCPSSLRISAHSHDWGADILRRLPADTRIFAFHLNLTESAFFPHDRAEFCNALSRAGVHVVNAKATNISKAFVQAVCKRLGLPTTEAAAEGDPNEMLIIKTNVNYGGLGERALEVEDLRILARGSFDCQMDAQSYKIVRRRDITSAVWRDPALFIERFVRNRSDRFCRVYLLSEYLVISEVVDHAAIKKMPFGIERTNWFCRVSDGRCQSLGTPLGRVEDLARQLEEFVRFLRIDFAAIDVVIDDDNQYFIIDVNTTPSWRNTTEPSVEAFLRSVINGLIRNRAPVFTF